jgi:hypothetical protein
MLQVRRRDLDSKEVMIEERRYDKAGPEGAPAASSQSAQHDAGSSASSSVADSLDLGGAEDVGTPPSLLPLQTLGGGFGNSFADDDASDNPYAWAQRLREIPDKVRGSAFVSPSAAMVKTGPSAADMRNDVEAESAHFSCLRMPCRSWLSWATHQAIAWQQRAGGTLLRSPMAQALGAGTTSGDRTRARMQSGYS